MFAVPLSVGIALFVTEVASPRLKRPVVYFLDLLAVVPSVVFGLWVLVPAPPITTFYDRVGDVLGRFRSLERCSRGRPTVVDSPPGYPRPHDRADHHLAHSEVFDTTPRSEKEAATLGATRWEMIRGGVLHSKGGMVGATTLGLGRHV